MKHKYFTTKTALYLIGIFFSGICCMGCTDDPDAQRIINEGETCISLILQNASFTTRAGEQDIENKIETLHVLVFEKNTENSPYQYIRRKEMDAQGGNKFEVNLPATESAVKLLFLANYTDFSSITLNDTEDQVRVSLTTGFAKQPEENVPMFSEIEYQNGLLSGETFNEDLLLLRSIAKVSVKLSEDRNDWNDLFELVSIQAYRAGNQIQVIPNLTAMHETELKVTEASIPEGITYSLTTPSLEEAGTTPIYLPESVPWGNNEITEVTCLIIGGIYKEGISNPKVTYYRVDFRGKDDSNRELLGYILRNHHYKITIEEVDGPGTTHPEEAAESGSANMSVSVIDWDINDEIRYGEGGSGDEPLYFGLSGREIVLPWYKGAENTVVVKTNVDSYRIVHYENEDNESGVVLSSAEEGGAIETEHFIIEHNYTSLVYRTKENNRTAGELVERIHIEVDLTINGRLETISKYTQIRQLPANSRNKDYVSIYSMTGTMSNLGDEILREYAEPDQSIAFALRNFIRNEDYFGPAVDNKEVVVPFGGFSLGALQWETGLTLKKADLFEIIVTPPYRDVNNSLLSDPTPFEEVIYTWLNAESNRVLLLYNQKDVMAAKFGRKTELVSGISTGNNVTYHVPTDLVSYLAKGPFGDLTQLAATGLSAPSVALNAVWGLPMEATNAGIDPVLTYGNYIIVGVDPKQRIIFIGDPYLFDPENATSEKLEGEEPFFATDGVIRKMGEINYPPDVLLCNMIAWMAETVIGEQLAAE